MKSPKRVLFMGAHVLLALGLFLGSSLNSVADERLPSEIAGTKDQSYETCVRSGGHVQEVHPARCVSKDGKAYVQSKETHDSCRDACGDGECQEIVCMAVGCPCVESPHTCPVDCKEPQRGGLIPD